MLLPLVLIQSLFILALAEDEPNYMDVTWTVSLDQGEVIGGKFWNGDYFEFYGIPYATVPKGLDRFKGPLPPISWDELFEASDKNKHKLCPQLMHIDAEPIEDWVIGEEDCLLINLFVPTKAKKEGKVLPVMVYFHGGAYSLGYGNMVTYNNLLEHDVIVVSFNYRIGALGFLCLGTEKVPGNAGLKDQVAALRWIKNNIATFNGDPDDVTIAGFTVGASSVEILMLSEAADGLFNKVIADSGSALSPWALDLDPMSTAKNVAKSLGYDGDSIEDLTEFYLTANASSLAAKSMHIWHPNSTFAFAPCVERKFKDSESILTESPFKLFEEGRYKKTPVLMGFSNMEGISRLSVFDIWSEMMNKDFFDFLPADLRISKDAQEEVVEKIKEFYFDNKDITEENAQGYINYFSDAMFVCSILRSAQYHRKYSQVYLFEFSYVGRLNTEHQFMANISGASHRDQTAYVLNYGLSYIRNPADLNTRARMTTMWTNFVKYGKPIPETSELLPAEWRPYTVDDPDYLSIGADLELKSSPLEERFTLWKELYKNFYREPSVSEQESTRIKTEL